ncbi:MAG TPA: signal peptidase I [Bryobacteraceae bacterium]|nr:signal peptidase I [Bryobacteraceae bacterium]
MSGEHFPLPPPFAHGPTPAADTEPLPSPTPEPSPQLRDEPARNRPVEAKDSLREIIETVVFVVVLVLLLKSFVAEAFVIPTGSMENSLLIGDHLLVDKLAFAPPGPISKYLLPYTPVKRGDIIVFRYPVDISQTFVKRCMGVPGDRIRIVNKEVYLNGVKLNEPYKINNTDYIDSYRDNFPSEPNVTVDRRAIDMLEHHVVNGEVVVPPGNYFAMGDNRDSSLDSRYWGFVPRENIIGKPLIVYWSFDAPTDELNSSSISMNHILDLAENFFSKTRWHRTFKLLHGFPVK